jgi:hypothetical protein
MNIVLGPPSVHVCAHLPSTRNRAVVLVSSIVDDARSRAITREWLAIKANEGDPFIYQARDYSAWVSYVSLASVSVV